jgi:Asp-tRNA(Asn)/Glu-tRNA(Gln) amidotransferase C subunit
LFKQLSDKDQEEIQAKFNELKDKLNLLKKIAIDNQFLDSDDIIDMVDKINNVTIDKKQEMKNVPATSAKMVKTLENKTDAESMINDSTALLKSVSVNLQDPQIATSKKLQDFTDELDKIAQFFSDPNNLDPVLKYQDIKENYDT